MKEAQAADYVLEIDLPNQVIKSEQGFKASFDIHPYWKEMLVNGWDEISITLKYDEHISEYEKKNSAVTV